MEFKKEPNQTVTKDKTENPLKIFVEVEELSL